MNTLPAILEVFVVDFVIPSRLRNFGSQITGEGNIQSLKLSFYWKNHCRKMENGSNDSYGKALPYKTVKEISIVCL